AFTYNSTKRNGFTFPSTLLYVAPTTFEDRKDSFSNTSCRFNTSMFIPTSACFSPSLIAASLSDSLKKGAIPPVRLYSTSPILFFRNGYISALNILNSPYQEGILLCTHTQACVDPEVPDKGKPLSINIISWFLPSDRWNATLLPTTPLPMTITSYFLAI